MIFSVQCIKWQFQFNPEPKKIVAKDENIDLAELESFAQNFKKQRIKFGT